MGSPNDFCEDGYLEVIIQMNNGDHHFGNGSIPISNWILQVIRLRLQSRYIHVYVLSLSRSWFVKRYYFFYSSFLMGSLSTPVGNNGTLRESESESERGRGRERVSE